MSRERLESLLAPIMFAVYPILFLFEHNQTEVDLSLLWGPLAISAAGGAGLFLVFRLLLKRDPKAGVLSSIVVVAFFYFGFFLDVATGRGLAEAAVLPVWIALFLVGVVACLRTRRPLAAPTRVLSILGAVLVLIPVSGMVLYRVRNPVIGVSDPRLWSKSLDTPRPTQGAPMPDIYYLVPDDYARADVLSNQLGYDNTAFLDELQQRGFVVAQQGRSPYSDSESNMASALNLDYLSRIPTILGNQSQDVLIVKKVLEDNRASQFLSTLGYQYLHMDSDNVTFGADNPQISPLAAPDNLTYLWLHGSILREVGGAYGFNQNATDERFRQSILTAFERLRAVPGSPGPPKFVFFHTLMPHEPYVFGADGEAVTFPAGSDPASTNQGVDYYVNELRFVNQELLRTIDQILARSTTPPIIVVQADEGFEALPEEFGDATMQDMRVKGLSAFFLPGKDPSTLPQDLNNVNTFRFLFDQYFGTQLGMLTSASYPEGDVPYQFVEMHVRGDPVASATPTPSP